MEIKILGSGSPLPQSSRAGQSIVVSIDNNHLLFDCGPMTVERLLENKIKLNNISNLFLTHQHIDHNSSFFHFVLTSWMYGRQDLSVYGPEGTDILVNALEDIYSEDVDYRKEFGRPVEGITEIDYRCVDPETIISQEEWEVSVHKVSHSISTYAYRVDVEGSNSTFVYSGDTEKIDSLSEFAEDADILVHDAAVGSTRDIVESDSTCDRESWKQYLSNNPEPKDTPIVNHHSSAKEAGEIAEDANVDKLVLTHFLPSQDTKASRKQAAKVFSGEIYIANDGLTFSL